MKNWQNIVKTIQLGDNLFVDIANGDLFFYSYNDSYFAVKEVENDIIPPIDEYCVEILSFYSKRHFSFRRLNGAYWWEEIRY